MLKRVRVVLVHGIFCKGKSMRRLAKALEAEGHECYCPDLVPNTGKAGLDELAGRLEEFVETVISEGEPFVLVGFSMGAVVSRAYLQGCEGAKRVVAFYSISGPHCGSWTAWFWRGKGPQDLRPGSSFLKRLDGDEGRLGEVPVVCYWTPFDLMVFPPKSACWRRAERHVKMLVPAHPLMLGSRKMARDLVERVGALEL